MEINLINIKVYDNSIKYEVECAEQITSLLSELVGVHNRAFEYSGGNIICYSKYVIQIDDILHKNIYNI